MKVTKDCKRKLEDALTSVVNDALLLGSPMSSRRSSRVRKQNVTMIKQSHEKVDTMGTFVSPSNKRKASAATPRYHTPSPPVNGKGQCGADNSLASLASRFRHFIQTQPQQIIDAKGAAELLQVERRRLYDVTNVLEGAGLVEKIDPSVPTSRIDACVIGNFRWVDIKTDEERIMQSCIDRLRHEEEQLEHWLDLLQSQADLIQDTTGSVDLYIHSAHLQSLLPADETFLAIVPPPGSQLLHDIDQPHAISIQLPTPSNAIPEAYLMETNDQPLVKLDLDYVTPPPWLESCASDGWTVDSACLDALKYGDAGFENTITPVKDYDGDSTHWLQGFSLPPLLRRSSSAAANAA